MTGRTARRSRDAGDDLAAHAAVEGTRASPSVFASMALSQPRQSAARSMWRRELVPIPAPLSPRRPTGCSRTGARTNRALPEALATTAPARVACDQAGAKARRVHGRGEAARESATAPRRSRRRCAGRSSPIDQRSVGPPGSVAARSARRVGWSCTASSAKAMTISPRRSRRWGRKPGTSDIRLPSPGTYEIDSS